MTELLDLPGELLNVAGQIYNFVVSIPGTIAGYFVDALVTVGTLLFYPIYALLEIFYNHLINMFTQLYNILAVLGDIVNCTINFVTTVAGVFGDNVWSSMVVLLITIILTVKLYNILAGLEIWGFKLPHLGR